MRRSRLGSASPLAFFAAFSALRAAFFGLGAFAGDGSTSASLAPRHIPISTEYSPVMTDERVGEHRGFTRKCVNRIPSRPIASMVGVCRSVFQYAVQSPYP